MAYLKRILPPSCDILGLAADGVIGKSGYTAQINQGPDECE